MFLLSILNAHVHQISVSDRIHRWDNNILNLKILITIMDGFNKLIPMRPTAFAFQLRGNAEENFVEDMVLAKDIQNYFIKTCCF